MSLIYSLNSKAGRERGEKSKGKRKEKKTITSIFRYISLFILPTQLLIYRGLVK